MKNMFTIFGKKTIFTFGLLSLFATASFGQAVVPPYFNNNGNSGSIPEPLNSNANNKAQWIYGPGVFNSMGILGGATAPLGLIDTIYLRATNSSAATYNNFTVSLSQNVGTQQQFGGLTYNTGMTTLLQSASYPITTAANGWFAIPLTNAFFYDPTQSLVLEVKHNGVAPAGALLAKTGNTPNQRIFGAFASSIGTSSGVGQANFGIHITLPAPCNMTTLNVGVITPTNPTICPGKFLSLSAPNATVASGITYQWQQSVAPFTTWTNIVGATSLNYQTMPLSVTTRYRLTFLCTTSGDRDTSAINIVTVAPPSYATLPYSQDFESWTSYCDINEVPSDFHWSNSPVNGNESWRREDDGVSANWGSAGGGLYNPPSTTGNHSARFHSFFSLNSGVGFDWYVDCSGPGSKTLSYDYKNNNVSGGSDNLTVQYSIAGGPFISVGSQGGSQPNGDWQPLSVAIPSTNAQTRIRFLAFGGSNFVAASDIGIDNIKVIPPCFGQPVAGMIDSVTACPNKAILLSLVGNTVSGNLTYQWDTASSCNGPWGFEQGSAGPNLSVTLTKPKYYRCRVTCTGSGLVDTTACRYIDLLPFYICYCDKAANIQFVENIGNVQILKKPNRDTLLNNGNGLPTLSNLTSTNLYSQFFPSITPPILYKDSSYYLNVKGISFVNSFNASYAKVYIDYNRDGVYNVTSEVALQGAINAAGNYIRLDSFKVPSISNFGLTGMRVILQEGGNQNTVLPCGTISRGEVEDYVINLQRLPCNQPPSAGISIIDDTTTCPNNQVRIINNTHDRFFANLTFSWQQSTDGITFSDIVGGAVDTLLRTVNQSMWYRYRVTCQGSSVSFSNVVRVRVLPPSNCISVSASTGPGDISDIGAFIMSEPPPTNTNIYTFSTGGPHLNNFASYKYYTNRTTAGDLKLKVDTNYKVSVFHIIKSPIHNDAQVSVFIDFDNNQLFDPVTELVYSGVSTAANGGFLFGNIAIPATAVQNTPLVLRVVLNDDLSINSASSTGVGPYVSGETEDYFVRFVPKKTPLGIEALADIDEVGIYPNPTSGELNIDFVAKQTTNVDVEIVNLTGSVLRTEKYGHVSGQQHFTMDVSDLAAGVYLMRFTTDNAKFVRKITVK